MSFFDEAMLNGDVWIRILMMTVGLAVFFGVWHLFKVIARWVYSMVTSG